MTAPLALTQFCPFPSINASSTQSLKFLFYNKALPIRLDAGTALRDAWCLETAER
jgi:hypothetical protein